MKKQYSILVYPKYERALKAIRELDSHQDFEVFFGDTDDDITAILGNSHCQIAVISQVHGTNDITSSLEKVCEVQPGIACILLGNHYSEQIAEAALEKGAYAYLPEHISDDYLKTVILNSLRQQDLNRSLITTEKKFNQIFDNAQDGIVSVDLDGRFMEFNQSFTDLTGYSRDELLKMSFFDLTPKKWHALEKSILEEQVLPKGFSELYEKEYIQKDGKIIPIEISAHLSTDSKGNPKGYWAFVRNISKRKLTERTLREQLKEVMTLQDLTSAGARAKNIDGLLQEATKILGESLYPENFGIFILDGEKQILRRHYSYQTNVENDKLVGFEISINKGIIGRAFRTGQPQCVYDVSEDPDYVRGYNESLSEIAVPIFIHGSVYGVINAESPVADRFADEDKKLLVSLANQLSTSIAKIQYQNARNQQAKEISALYETAIATTSITDTDLLYKKIYDHVLDLFPLDTFSIVEFEPHDESIRIAIVMENGKPMKEWQGTHFEREESGLIGWVIRNQKPFLAHDLSREKTPVPASSSDPPARSWLGVPLIAKGKAVGGMSVQSFSPNVFDKNHQRLLESLAALLAGVIVSTQLIENSKNQIARLEALHDIDLVINSSMDLRVTLNILLDQVIEKLKIDAAVVMLYNPQNNMLEYTASHGFRSQSIREYSIQMGDVITTETAIERHIIDTFDLLDENPLPFSALMQEEGFVSYYSVPLIAKGQVKGVLDIFNRTLLNPDDEWFNFLETIGGQAAIAIDNMRLLEELHHTNTALRSAYDRTLEGWSRALDLRDQETEGHTQRVVNMTLQIAKTLGVPETDQVHIRRGALLHDIGKMGIPDAILLKPGPLSEVEWDTMHKHPIYAYDLLYPIKHLRPALDIPYCHHEHWDGTGYPRGLKTETIPIAARIFAVVDVWDALTSDRPYRKAWTARKALDYINEQREKYFDPKVVDIFISLIKNELLSTKGH